MSLSIASIPKISKCVGVSQGSRNFAANSIVQENAKGEDGTNGDEHTEKMQSFGCLKSHKIVFIVKILVEYKIRRRGKHCLKQSLVDRA